MKLLKRQPTKGYIDNYLWVQKSYVNVEGTKAALTFSFVDAYSPTKSRMLYLWKEMEHHLLVPRAFWGVGELPFDVVDCRPTSYTAVTFNSKIKLDHLWKETQGVRQLTPTGDNVQAKSLSALQREPGGVLQLACGKGKTVVALELIARAQVPALVVLDNTQLLSQWADQAVELLGIAREDLGLIQADQFDWKKPLVLATYQTLAIQADTLPEEVRRWFGIIIWDEAHHISAPTFAKSADIFYGSRYGLTATPIRADGLHIIHDFHIGKVLYKDLTQTLKPKIYFKWTGLAVDETNPRARVRDKNGKEHRAMLAGYFGQWRQRLDIILADVIAARASGRKVLVLSDSVDETVNLAALWADPNCVQLYSDIPIPTPQDVGETLNPVVLPPTKVKRIGLQVAGLDSQLKIVGMHPMKVQEMRDRLDTLNQTLKQCEVADKIARELARRQKKYIRELTDKPSTGGFMIHAVPVDKRTWFLKNREVIFAITKYGKEGMDWPELDTVLVCEPFSSRNSLQQLLGRPTRVGVVEKLPVVVFYEDNIGPLIGMCKKLKTALRDWPVEEGGPLDYDNLGHPGISKWKAQNQPTQIFP